ncbi:MAG: hypothetical protein IT372_07555 [Polyangiaceae bacterium]|nr:hypothetical protein [Polyangiaceae bacterium]
MGRIDERTGRAALAAAGALALAAVAPCPAAADPLPDNRYALDLFQGPILAPLRVIGIAGAYAGYAEGIAGMVANAAAPALREPFSVSWFEADIAPSISIPLEIFENNDFDNSGKIDADYSNFIFMTLGGQLQAGAFGAGINAELQRYSLEAAGVTNVVMIGKYHVLAGVQLLGGQLVLGGGARAVTLGVDAPEADLTIAGVAPQLGFLVRPDWESFRFGATFRFPVNGGQLIGDETTTDAAGVRRAGGLVLPDEVVLPWELEVGMAIQVGPKPLNPEWINPHDQEREAREARAAELELKEARWAIELRAIEDPAERAARKREIEAERARWAEQEEADLTERYAALKRERRARYWNWPREHLLLTAEILVTGAVDRGVSLEEFLGQGIAPKPSTPSVVGTSGASVNFSPRFGIETEPIPGLVHTRFGSYYEPNRFGEVGRQHFTFGADLRMFTTTWWGLVPDVTYKVQGSMDLAPRYESLSIGIGVWR